MQVFLNGSGKPKTENLLTNKESNGKFSSLPIGRASSVPVTVPPKVVVNVSTLPFTQEDGKSGSKPAELPQKNLRPVHKGSRKQQEAIDYAWQISKDPNFLYLLKAENGKVSIDRKSDVVGSNGYRDYGYCQINKGFHSKIVKDSRFFTDMKWQLDNCYRLYKGGTTFYGLIKFKSNKTFQSKVKAAFDWV